jgi:hypothetical protein
MNAKKKAILAVSLIVLWAGLAVWQWRLLEEPVHIPLSNVTGFPSVGRHAKTEGTGGLRVNLDLLALIDRQRQTTFTVSRNIFAMPRPDGTFSAGIDPAFTGQRGSASAETLAQQTTAVELEQYRYLGFLRVGEGGRNNNDMAVLRKDDEVLVLKVGDRVDDHLILKRITAENVTIRDTGTRMDQTVPLSDEPIGQE